MGFVSVNKNTAFVVVFVSSLVGVASAAERSTSLATSFSLETDTEKEAECDCGPHGDCKLEKDGKKTCFCEYGFQDRDGLCEVCECGRYGVCFFNQSVKTCHCLTEYADKDGICKECSCSLLFLDGSRERIRCFFENDVERCNCPSGYKEENVTCIDINECLIPSSCPDTSDCVNLPGDYFCMCKEGFIEFYFPPHGYACKDVDECEHDVCSHNASTTCVNTQGSFYCECKAGYSWKQGTKTPGIKGCEKDKLGAGYIILITIAVVVVVAAVSFFVKKRFFQSTRTPEYRAGI